jgi:hypothetical protein
MSRLQQLTGSDQVQNVEQVWFVASFGHGQLKSLNSIVMTHVVSGKRT